MSNSRVSRRAQSIPNSPIRAMFNEASKLSNVINFGIGEPDFTTPARIVEAGMRAAKEGFTHYTANAGDVRLRRAIATDFAAREGVEYSPDDEVIVTVGAMEALFLALQTTLEPGDEVIIPSPLWPNYVAHALLAGAKPVAVEVSEENGFRLTAEMLESKISERTKALLLNSPCNPTGGMLGENELREIAEICVERDLIVFFDEVYHRIVYDGRRARSIAGFPGMRDRTITVNSMSKTFAMCGWRVGWALGPADIVKQMVKLQEDVAACAPSVAQAAAIEALTNSHEDAQMMINEYSRRREIMVNGLNRIPGFSCRMPEGTFYVFANVKSFGKPSEELAREFLHKARVVTVPGAGFGSGGEGYLRFSFANSEANILEGIARLDSLVRNNFEPIKF